MQQAKKFLFKSNFDDAPSNNGRVKAAQIFTEEDLATARKQGFKEGTAAGRQESEATTESITAIALQTIGKSILDLSVAQSQTRKSNARDATELAKSITRKVLPEISRHGALTEIEAMVCKCLTDHFDEPRIVIRVHDSLLDGLRTCLDTTAANAGFAGKFVLLAEDGLQVTDCRVEWADGGAERDEAHLWQEIEEATQRFISQLGEDPSSNAIETTPQPETPTLTKNKDVSDTQENGAQKEIPDSKIPGETHER